MALLGQLLHRFHRAGRLVSVVQRDEAQLATVHAPRLVGGGEGDLHAGLHRPAQLLGGTGERGGHAEGQLFLHRRSGGRALRRLHRRGDSDGRALRRARLRRGEVRAQEEHARTSQCQRGHHAQQQHAAAALLLRQRGRGRRLRTERQGAGGPRRAGGGPDSRGQLAFGGHGFLLGKAVQGAVDVALRLVLAPGRLEQHLGPRLEDGALGADGVPIDAEGAFAQLDGQSDCVEALLAAELRRDQVAVLDPERARAARKGRAQRPASRSRARARC